ncbi:Isochorismatase-like protein [Dipodascopsis uninucleata]
MAYKVVRSMPVDLQDTALLVIDMQENFREVAGGLIHSLVPLIKHFKEKKLPVVFTQHGHVFSSDDSQLLRWWGKEGSIERYSDSWMLMKEIEDTAACMDSANVIRLENKDRYDAFLNTDLESILRNLKVKKVVITGTMTNLCCETTARSAFDRDFWVYFPDDGNATLTQEMHRASILNLSYGFAQITTLDAIENAVRKI